MNSITHFSPPHELKREEMVIRSYEKCKLCQQEVLPGVVYRCERPKYFVHGSCAELPWHLRHPFHPDHTLTQFDIAPDSKSCSVCGDHFGGCAYRCSECEFVLNLSCAALTPSRIRGPELKINHQHPVTAFDKPKDHNACGVPKNLIYMCQKCNFSLDIKCATAKHPLIRSKIHQDDLAYFNNTSDN
ncbi:protein VACUOLELESS GAMETOPHYTES-like [Coffea arabica]|uniref:Protein VACUOLELESS GAMETOPHYTES-like n=1 Tax=Coffea arabica TaxID=13443 RepID=A0A6P6S484_COFAR|nr:uncharacterized protein LOC113687617 [Coffea arabica]